MRRHSGGQADAAPVTKKRRAFKDFIYGSTAYPFVHHALQMKREAEALFLLVTMGDLAGLPIMPPVYSLRLLPHIVPEIAQWKRQLARHREFWEKEEFDLHGV
jgi:hypothetical protein